MVPLSESRMAAVPQGIEESPGFTETRCRLTAGRREPTDSATENKPPMARKGTGKGETVG